MESDKIKTLPQNFVHCSRDDLIVLIARMLNSLISINDNFNDSNLSPSNLTRFHSRTPPGISVYSYLARLARYSSLENAVLLAAVYYIDLLSTVYNSFTLNSLTVHRFLLTATTVGSKGLCDSFCTNSHYAKVGGIQANELDILEREFLSKVNYRILPRDFNIERCANENRIVSSYERKKSIDQLEGGLKTEQELQQAQTQFDNQNQNQSQPPGSSGPTSSTNTTSNNTGTTSDESFSSSNKDNNPLYEKNAGYNVLDLYYQKMIVLVGKETGIDDKQLPQSFIYALNNQKPTEEQKEFEDKNLIKTDPDTLPDIIYNKMIQSLITAYRDHLKNWKKKQHPSIQQVKNSEPSSSSNNNNGKNNNNNIPKSPMKRSIDDTISSLPNGKRSTTHPSSNG
ncbi:hypothetical protein BN7_5618 [Wickerhamomyces ciferrii]|uniref:Uncharacterized protein n=1 Tax=Wickerhamomyces ciferrii (strain ATCC 14091 / BCRC 22168 / CBS 111 / JCM 3599 / NBRC 0793 / NRRL Y-1031 F-60-10) TaxID=1206466 RepID=K0KS89_WICCF|nr:uncharacterized protein BN7_5618 [Wickerhamomyces ciferrii]CCH46031.1 hypothetical protein BN7_5618 [Wickerhamomyces ciferrii]